MPLCSWFQRKLIGQKTRNHNVEEVSDAENHEDYIKVIWRMILFFIEYKS
uniref:Uncharacterized protein n=1 Tax=Vitis vinifera TaxID=29760 RepID=F6HG82_VITVI